MILQRGDVIHLAMPAGHLPNDDRKAFDELVEFYDRYGITVGITSHVRNLPEYKVVAVIRNKPEKPQGIPRPSGGLTAS